MSRRLPFFGGALALVALTMSGCVDRRFIVESDPPGAIVYANGKRIDATPADQSFTYYGIYRFVFVRPGYETLTVDEKIRAPWWSVFPLDFVVENLWPWTIRDHRFIRYPLQPRLEVPPDDVLKQGDQLRARGQLLISAGGAMCAPAPGPIVVAPEMPITSVPPPPPLPAQQR